MSQTTSIEFTAQEIQALVRLLDIAVKGGGLAVAGDAVVLYNKIALAAQGPQPEEG